MVMGYNFAIDIKSELQRVSNWFRNEYSATRFYPFFWRDGV